MIRSAAALALALTFALAAGAGGGALAEVIAPTAERVALDKVAVRWRDRNPVDVYAAARPDAPLGDATLVSANDGDGKFDMTVPAGVRPYFVLRDRKSGAQVRVSERLMPLEHGSNFRDLGGYMGAGGKHVRWGRIYRSGGQPLLTPADVKFVRDLGVKDLIDLRSSDERVLAPTRLEGIRYSAVGYPMADVSSMDGAYRGFPTLLAPHMRILFAKLLAGEGPLAYNCSAGQDRTGFATAMVLTVLGVPRQVILEDYHLSTTYRRPEYEMAKFDPAAFPGNGAAKIFAGYAEQASVARPRPLFDAEQRALLLTAFDEIVKRWGSVDNYLRATAGVGPAERAKLRAMYLE